MGSSTHLPMGEPRTLSSNHFRAIKRAGYLPVKKKKKGEKKEKGRNTAKDKGAANPPSCGASLSGGWRLNQQPDGEVLQARRAAAGRLRSARGRQRGAHGVLGCGAGRAGWVTAKLCRRWEDLATPKKHSLGSAQGPGLLSRCLGAQLCAGTH